jgi:hypothetical protein
MIEFVLCRELHIDPAELQRVVSSLRRVSTKWNIQFRIDNGELLAHCKDLEEARHFLFLLGACNESSLKGPLIVETGHPLFVLCSNVHLPLDVFQIFWFIATALLWWDTKMKKWKFSSVIPSLCSTTVENALKEYRLWPAQRAQEVVEEESQTGSDEEDDAEEDCSVETEDVSALSTALCAI